MELITFRVSAELKNSLENNAKNEERSVGSYIRKLVELGLKVEEHSKANCDKNSETNSDELDKKIKIAIMENLLLSRGFLRSTANLPEEKIKEILDNTSAKAREIVENYYK